jgi:hypothetical protein
VGLNRHRIWSGSEVCILNSPGQSIGDHHGEVLKKLLSLPSLEGSNLVRKSKSLLPRICPVEALLFFPGEHFPPSHLANMLLISSVLSFLDFKVSAR